jgi:hypothetical protein
MAGSPTTVTLVAATAQAVTIDGIYSSLEVIPLAAAQQVFARGDGVTATAGTSLEYACPAGRVTRVPTGSANGTTTVVSLISATGGQVQVRAPMGEWDSN